MTFRVNDSPLAGNEGTSGGRMIRDRCCAKPRQRALRVSPSDENDAMEVAGRGELQLGILFEPCGARASMLSVRPKVLFVAGNSGELEEPIESRLDVDGTSGVVVQKMSERKAELVEMRALRRIARGWCSTPHARPDRLSGRALTDTRGTRS